MRLHTFALFIGSLSLSTCQAHLRDAIFSETEMVVSADYIASQAGRKVLAAGGTAVDAMIAVQTVLGLVEPQSSGIGGGAFVVYYDAAENKLTTFDAREKAPMTATEGRFLDADGNALGFFDAWQSALSVGVPGVPRLMEDMHRKYGALPWADLFEDAKSLALNGYEQTVRTVEDAAELLAENESCEDGERLFFRDSEAFAYFIDAETCTPKPAGTILTNPEYAEVLDLLSTGGADSFYTGQLAEDIIAKIASDRKPTEDPIITLEDMAAYEVIEREPVCKSYRGKYNVCGMGPPSSGALAVGQILGIMDNFNLTSYDLFDVETVHLFTQAMRLAFADRNLYVGDADFITVPIEGMLDENYLAERAGLITDMDMGSANPGTPPGCFDPSAPQTESFESGTSHISIVDKFGNALSMTTTVESYFGSGLFVRGFILNNQLTDFSFDPADLDGVPIANRVQPSKRPRSSMSPSIVLDSNGALAYLVGSPGGFRIIGYVSRAIISMVDFGYDAQEAVSAPHTQNQNGDTELETPIHEITSEYDIATLTTELEARGHIVVERGGEESGLSIVQVTADGLLGGADPRRNGLNPLSPSLVEIVGSTDIFSTLNTLVVKAGLVEALNGDGPFTMFAPTNEAFAALVSNAPEVAANLVNSESWNTHLANVLLYHVVAGAVTSDEIVTDGCNATYGMLNGDDIFVQVTDEVSIFDTTGDKAVVQNPFDVIALNGVAHTIDKVLHPAWVSFSIPDLGAADPGGRFGIVLSLIDRVGLDSALAGFGENGGGLTLFAPLDSAFEGIDTSALTDDQVTQILLYHVVPAVVASTDLSSGPMSTLQGNQLDAVVSDMGVSVNGISVVEADALANNGIVHVIDQVLMPPLTPVEKCPSLRARKLKPLSS